LAESWLRSIPGIREGEPLARHCWYGIGGTAEFFLELESEVPLARLLPRLAADATPVFPLGLGTNTLFSGPLLPGLTIRMANENIQIDGETVVVSAGYPMPRLAAETGKAGRAGLEFGAGVPGTVGGSVFGNAGAFGTEVKDCVMFVEAIDAAGRMHQLSAADCQFAYRDSAFKSGPARGWVITRATFAVRPGDPTTIRERIKQVQKHRRETQPIDKRSLGSTFKNPPGDSAGRLIEAAGLKGRRIGGAQVSPKHANFIVNVGGATADDVLALVAEMRDGVRQRFGIELEPEIRIVGSP
jgi:UDP-N-acetylmuramate dehydrogenase